MLTFDEETHTYRYNGKIVPSVTQVMSRVGVREKDGEFKPIGSSDYCHDQRAADFGVEFHKVAEFLVQGYRANYDPDMEPWVVGLRKFIDEWELKPIAVEKLLYSRLGYAGMVDFFGGCKLGEHVIIDWKSSSAAQSYWNNQTAAYENAIKEEYKIRRALPRVAVRFFEYGYKAIVRDTRKNPEDWTLFHSALNVLKLAA